MNFTFLRPSGAVAFYRSDATEAEWCQDEMVLYGTFPIIPGKTIERGMTVLFQDPATNAWQAYEIRQCSTFPEGYYQQFTAEDLSISELTDCHMDSLDMYGVPPQVALASLLQGTQWQVGTVDVGNTAIQDQIRAQINALGLNGNVDLTARPLVYPEKMRMAGYTDFEGDYATLYSMTYTEEIKSGALYTFLMTPIRPNGDVLSQSQLDDYFYNLCDTCQTIEQFKAKDEYCLLMHYLPGEQIDEMEIIADKAHNLSDEWEVANMAVLSSAEFNRGAVWQNVSTVQKNWNVRVLTRVTVNSTGIVGRYLDIIPAVGVDRGLRLAVNKNVTDPSVVYDDSELYTALYGYGGSYSEGSGDSRKTLEYNFAAVEWEKTEDHPAKPAGQLFVEYPEMTALFGRNGRPRFGFYQNTGIKDPQVLLQKTWESLKNCCEPKISITGTVTDLKRLGYADQPLRLYDMAIVELEPVGLLFYKQIIKLTVNLLDATKNRPEIGDYIPNIIYINRETENHATGGSKGRGGKGGTKVDLELDEYQTEIYDTGRQVGMYARKVDKQGNILEQAGMDIDPETGVIVYAEGKDNMIGSMFHVQRDMITSEVHNRESADTELSSRITQTANKIELEVSERKGADNALSARITVEANRITQEVTRATTAEGTLSGRITTTADAVTAEVTRATTAEGTLSGRITVNADKVSLVVTDDGQGNYKTNSAEIVAGINSQTGSYVKIKADTINLTGYVTATQLNAVDAKIDNLTSGLTNATKLWTTDLQTSNATISTLLTYQGHQITTLNAYNRNGENIAVLGWRQD